MWKRLLFYSLARKSTLSSAKDRVVGRSSKTVVVANMTWSRIPLKEMSFECTEGVTTDGVLIYS